MIMDHVTRHSEEGPILHEATQYGTSEAVKRLNSNTEIDVESGFCIENPNLKERLDRWQLHIVAFV